MYFLPSVDDHWSVGSSTVLIDQMTYQILSKCGFSLMCVIREPATPNDLLHWTQLYALSLLRLLRSPAWLNDLWHEHLCILPPLHCWQAYVSTFWFCFAQIRIIWQNSNPCTGSLILGSLVLGFSVLGLRILSPRIEDPQSWDYGSLVLGLRILSPRIKDP